MAVTAKEFISVLQGWVGRNEKDGTHKMIIDLYNSKTPRARGYKVTYKDAWCATTMSAAAIKLGATDICPIECSCNELIKLAKQMGIWIETDSIVPETGDWVIYDWDDQAKDFRVADNKGFPEHVGAVECVDTAKGTCSIIEGNFSNAVKRRTLEINGRYIRGYIRPRYAAEQVVVPAPAPTTPTTEGVKYKMKTLRRGSKGNQVTIFETIMKEMGFYKGAIDEDFGPKCEAAANAFMEVYTECGTNGKPDDTWGPKCWRKMFSLVGA